MDILDVARYVVVYTERRKEPVTSVKLNYILFAFHRLISDTYGVNLFPTVKPDNRFGYEATHPTYEKVYRAYTKYGMVPIRLKLPYEEERDILSKPFMYKSELNTCIEKIQGKHIYELYEWYLKEKKWFNAAL